MSNPSGLHPQDNIQTQQDIMEIEKIDFENATELQKIKHTLWLMRNGIISDVYRQSGSPYKIILGVNLPQLVEIARQFQQDKETAQALWEGTTTREHSLIAPMLYPKEQMDKKTARQWLMTAQTYEAADILCHRLLRHLPYAPELVEEFDYASDDNTDLQVYTALRLARNLMPAHNELAVKVSEKVTRQDRAFSKNVIFLCKNIVDEATEEIW